MAAARDQAARVVRTEPETAADEVSRDATAQLADQLRTHVAEETKRRPAETPADRAISFMLAPSKPRSMKTLRAPSKICRRFEESSSAAR